MDPSLRSGFQKEVALQSPAEMSHPMPRYFRSLLIATLTIFCLLTACAAEVPYDIIIRNGHIIDGTGSPWYSGDIGIRNGRIAAIGFLGAAQAKRTIDARALVVAPGFIDMLGQSE